MEDFFKFLSSEYQGLKLKESETKLQCGKVVPEIDINYVSPLNFYRSHVSSNQPVLIHGACKHWTAVRQWTGEYLRDKYGEKDVIVAVTPNGYADAVTFDPETNKEYFVTPEERKMKFSQFWEALNNPTDYHGIYYLQRQNSNLTEDFPELLQDIEKHIPWATDAFGAMPDAVNFWVGDGRAVTSMHKDPYENIYCVVNGYKDFILHPPTDRPWIPYNKYPTATYIEDQPGKFRLKLDSECHSESLLDLGPQDRGVIPWIGIDPLAPDLVKYPKYKNSSPIHVRVSAGDALYLPSLWYHHVRQSHGCIAVNYWYDMQYDVKYAYHSFLDLLVESENDIKSKWYKDSMDIKKL